MSDPQTWLEAANLIGLITPERPRPRIITPQGGVAGFADPQGINPYISAFNQTDRAAGQSTDAYYQGFTSSLNPGFNAAVADLPAPGETRPYEPGSQLDLEAKAAAAAAGTSSSTTGAPAPAAPGGDPVQQWQPLVDKYAQQFGVDPRVLTEMMRVESGGDPNAAQAGTTSIGLMQVKPDIWEPVAQQLGLPSTYTPDGQVAMAAAILAGAPGTGGVPGDWRGNFSHLFFPNDDPLSGMTQAEYLSRLDAAVAAPEPDAATSPIGSVSSVGHVADMWGGQDVPITQGIGEHGGEVYNNNPHIYDYCQAYGVVGHCGVDYGLPRGTPLVAPIAGTVIVVGNRMYDPQQGTTTVMGEAYVPDGAGGIGEVRLLADNGDIIVLGHMATSDVKPGQRITVGQPLGTSGQSDARPESAHLHMEIRVKQSDGNYRIADPEDYFAAPLESAPVTTPALGAAATTAAPPTPSGLLAPPPPTYAEPAYGPR